MGGVPDDVNPLGRKLLPMPVTGPAFGMGSELIADGRIIGKGSKLEKVIHPVTGKF